MIGIERHESVLLAGNAEGDNLRFARTKIGDYFSYRLDQSIPPPAGILFGVTRGQSFGQSVSFARTSDDFARITVEGDGF